MYNQRDFLGEEREKAKSFLLAEGYDPESVKGFTSEHWLRIRKCDFVRRDRSIDKEVLRMFFHQYLMTKKQPGNM